MINESNSPQIADNSDDNNIDLLAPVGSTSVARVKFNKVQEPRITLTEPSDVDESGYQPPASFIVYGLKAVKALRELCDRSIKAREEYLATNAKAK